MRYLIFLIGTMFTTISQSQESVIAEISGDQFFGVVGKVATIVLQSETCVVSSQKSDESEFKIVYSCQDRSQTLWDINVPVPGDFPFDDPKFALLWAGDKDNDGKIDLTMEMSPKYSCTKEVIYMSTLADSGQLVGVFNQPKTTCPD